MADVTEEIKKLGEDLKARLEKAEGAAKEGAKLATDAQTEMKNIAEQQRELLENAKKQQQTIDEMGLAMARKGGNFGDGEKQFKSLADVFLDRLEKHRGDGDVLAALNHKNGIGLDTRTDHAAEAERKEAKTKGQKAVGDLSTAGNITGTLFTLPGMVPGGMITPPTEEHIRNFITTGSTTSDLVRYIEMRRKEGGFAMVPEGGLKPQLDYVFESKDVKVRKIAGHIRVPDEMMDDLPFLATLLATQGMEDLKLKEDEQILYGSGTGENLRGLFTAASAFATGSFRVERPNVYDIVLAMRLQLRNLKYRPTAAFLSPLDWALLASAKDTQGRPLFPELYANPQNVLRIGGMNWVENTAVEDNDIIVGDFATSAFLLDRKQAIIKTSTEDRDNFIRNMVTIVIEERIALPIVRPDAFVKATVTTAKAALTAV